MGGYSDKAIKVNGKIDIVYLRHSGLPHLNPLQRRGL